MDEDMDIQRAEKRAGRHTKIVKIKFFGFLLVAIAVSMVFWNFLNNTAGINESTAVKVDTTISKCSAISDRHGHYLDISCANGKIYTIEHVGFSAFQSKLVPGKQIVFQTDRANRILSLTMDNETLLNFADTYPKERADDMGYAGLGLFIDICVLLLFLMAMIKPEIMEKSLNRHSSKPSKEKEDDKDDGSRNLEMKDKNTFIDSNAVLGSLGLIGVVFGLGLFIYAFIIGQADSKVYLYFAAAVFCLILLLRYSPYQYVVIDYDSITVHGLFHIIQRKSWSEIQSIEVTQIMEKAARGGGMIATSYFLFNDGSSNPAGETWKNKKDTMIKIRYSKKNKRILNGYWKTNKGRDLQSKKDNFTPSSTSSV